MLCVSTTISPMTAPLASSSVSDGIGWACAAAAISASSHGARRGVKIKEGAAASRALRAALPGDQTVTTRCLARFTG